MKFRVVLHYAIIMGRKDLVKLLINSGANLLQKNKDKKTPYELCKPQTDYRIVEILKRAQGLFIYLFTYIPILIVTRTLRLVERIAIRRTFPEIYQRRIIFRHSCGRGRSFIGVHILPSEHPTHCRFDEFI